MSHRHMQQKNEDHYEGLQLLNEDIASSYQQIQQLTIQFQEFDGICERWQEKTSKGVKNLSKFIIDFIKKLQKLIQQQSQYNSLISIKEEMHPQHSKSQTSLLESTQNHILMIIQNQSIYQQLLLFASKHHLKTVVTQAISKCISTGCADMNIMHSSLQFIRQYCKPLVYKKFEELFMKFGNYLSSVQLHVSKVDGNRSVNLTEMDDRIMSLKIDLQILNSEIIEFIDSVLSEDHPNKPSKILAISEEYLLLVENSNYRELIKQIVGQISDLITQKFPIWNSLLYEFFNRETSFNNHFQESNREMPEPTNQISHKNRFIIEQYKQYVENILQNYCQSIELDQHSANFSDAKLSISIDEFSSADCMNKEVLCMSIQKQTIAAIYEYLTFSQNKQTISNRIKYLQSTIKSMVVQSEELSSQNPSKYNLPLQPRNCNANKIEQSNYPQKHFNHSNRNSKMNITQAESSLDSLQEFKVLKEMLVANTIRGKCSQTTRDIIRNQSVINKKKERKMSLGKKQLIFSKQSLTIHEEIEIKRIHKIIKVSETELEFYFNKGWMKIKFLQEYHTKDNKLMRHFLQLFVEKYGDTFPDIEFENRPTPRHCSRLSTSKSKYDHTYYC